MSERLYFVILRKGNRRLVNGVESLTNAQALDRIERGDELQLVGGEEALAEIWKEAIA